ncbi:MAG: hypothetical protein KatS3mg110_1542 [Pirellulaceae bacterium]|nr:MAG: hypothetical protein KatS3mg110_1542 [Pirellulaceae bacterium]
METPILKVEGLMKTFGRRTVVDGVSFAVGRQEIVGLLGPNGAGKTTSFRMTCGLIDPDRGTVWLNGVDVTRWPMHRRARDGGMGYLPQEASVFRKLTVEQNLLAPMELLGIPRRERRLRCQELLEQFELTAVRRQLAAKLSGGERRRSGSCSLLDLPSGRDPDGRTLRQHRPDHRPENAATHPAAQTAGDLHTDHGPCGPGDSPNRRPRLCNSQRQGVVRGQPGPDPPPSGRAPNLPGKLGRRAVSGRPFCRVPVGGSSRARHRAAAPLCRSRLIRLPVVVRRATCPLFPASASCNPTFHGPS